MIRDTARKVKSRRRTKTRSRPQRGTAVDEKRKRTVPGAAAEVDAAVVVGVRIVVVVVVVRIVKVIVGAAATVSKLLARRTVAVAVAAVTVAVTTRTVVTARRYGKVTPYHPNSKRYSHPRLSCLRCPQKILRCPKKTKMWIS